MCTAAAYKTKDFYFGRTLDYEFSYGDEITVTPQNFPFKFRHVSDMDTHYAIIGMAHIAEGYPLYYDAVNEKGLAAAGLNFVGNAVYSKPLSDKDNIAQFELIPYLLGKCSSVCEAEALLSGISIADTPFSDTLPPAQLHWIIADRSRAITLESVRGGIKIHDNPIGILTNNPAFEIQLFNLNNYMGLSAAEPQNSFSDKIRLYAYSRGMGALGLPGDMSSQSRFIRAAFTKANSVCGTSEEESVNQFFHILGSVAQVRGCCRLDNGKFEITQYTSCVNADKGIYYYTSYSNHRITAVDMQKENLGGSTLIRYPRITKENICCQN